MTHQPNFPPVILPKLGYRASEAAELFGVSVSKFRNMVKDGDAPSHHQVGGCAIWRGDELLAAFNRLTQYVPPDERPIDEGEGWDDILGDSED